jgi:redox-sensitive bicupin YhaK (pirin superfamily)
MLKNREIVKTIRGKHAIDGAGVHLVRVLGSQDVYDFDPFLMLDSFDSLNPEDYTAGFPWHPHRGIETITYIIQGRIEHMDSLGNKGAISAGESQWMTAGSGILHQEMPVASERMLGFQLWLNLPRAEKMAPPAYLSITQADIPVAESSFATVRVLSGEYGGVSGVTPRHIPACILDISLPRGKSLTLPAKHEETVFVFLMEGDAVIGAHLIREKTAVLFGAGDTVSFEAPPDGDVRLIYFSGKALHEPIAWGGPIVMNTREELNLAFDELRQGTFIKNKI